MLELLTRFQAAVDPHLRDSEIDIIDIYILYTYTYTYTYIHTYIHISFINDIERDRQMDR